MVVRTNRKTKEDHNNAIARMPSPGKYPKITKEAFMPDGPVCVGHRRFNRAFRVLIMALAVAVLVGMSLVCLGVPWPGDAAAG